MLLLSYSPQRAAYAVYPMVGATPDPVLSRATLTYSVYVKNGSALSWDSKQFSPYTRRRRRQFWVFGGVDELGKLRLNVEETPSTTSNLIKLLMGALAPM